MTCTAWGFCSFRWCSPTFAREYFLALATLLPVFAQGLHLCVACPLSKVRTAHLGQRRLLHICQDVISDKIQTWSRPSSTCLPCDVPCSVESPYMSASFSPMTFAFCRSCSATCTGYSGVHNLASAPPHLQASKATQKPLQSCHGHRTLSRNQQPYCSCLHSHLAQLQLCLCSQGGSCLHSYLAQLQLCLCSLRVVELALKGFGLFTGTTSW